MPAPDEWTDADFIPSEPNQNVHQPEVNSRERLEWYRREIRSRLGVGETQTQVISWLVSEGFDPGAAPRLVGWAMTAASLVSTRSPERGGLVIGVEVHTESGDGPAHVNTDPIESARARAAARKTRLAADGIVDSSNPEYEFAQPGDAAQSRLNHAKRNPGNILFALGILFFATCVACVIVAVLRM